ncbi:MAG: aspartyl/asparaginyl beta-hydroxylase domain-containing protein [Sphingomonas sp.]|uniref:aspartyl/asparaginyl beta-hydroxylase domain-containing protein n=1 Tax=Sphingomonas sp. TaxID=28214 RepID=UPI003F7D423A
MTLPDRAKLPLAFDVARLRADLAIVEGFDWTDHFVRQNYDGRWDVLPLRHQAGATHPIMQAYVPPDATEFVDAPVLAATPYFREVMAAFRCPLKAVRLMRLTPGSRIKEHQDHDLAADWGQARLHIPIVTNPGVTFQLNRVPVTMAPGETWYLRLSDPHAVTNDGDTDRVHLVIDCEADDWLIGQIAA